MSGEGPTWRAQSPTVGQIEQLTTRTRQIQAAIDAAGMGDPLKARIAVLEAENVALRAVEVAARDFMAYCRAREALWATFGQCDDDGHIGHTEDTCPAWGAVASDTMSSGDPAPIWAALAALDEARR